MTKERKIKWYTTLLMYYLLVYGVLHLVGAVTLLVFERGWGGFAYIWCFWFHIPIMLIGGVFAFIGKRVQNFMVWATALLLFVLSNGWWLYAYIDFVPNPNPMYLYLMLTTIVPIIASVQLMRLTKGE